MTDVILYAWARPLMQTSTPVVSNLDHTWVTNFPEKVDPDHQTDPPKGWTPPESYWYCWGSPHDVASQALGDAAASLSTANNITPYNVTAMPSGDKQYSPSSTSGAIVYYGLDGVCHNVANGILCATGTATTEPLRVQQAKGYPLSTFFFGTYGLNIAMWEKIRQKYVPGIKLPGDDFLSFMNQYVPADQQAELLIIRSTARIAIAGLRKKVAGKDFDFYPELSIIAAAALYGAKKLLGDNVFHQLFPSLDIDDTTWLRPVV